MIFQLFVNILISQTKAKYYFFFELLYLQFIRLLKKDKYYNPAPLVSIIIATYNRSSILINRTLPSVLAQTYTNIEVIIIGDHCIDNTPEMLKNFPDKRVHFFDLAKRGKYPKDIKDRWFVQGAIPRNMGMKIAKGEWFVFISDDDIIYPHHIDKLLKAAISKKVEFISAAYDTIKDGKKLIVQPEAFHNNNSFIVGGMQTWLYRSYLKFFKWNVDAWRKNWDRPIDYDLQVRFFNAGVRMGFINDIVFYSPPVEGTNTTGYQAALLADKK